MVGRSVAGILVVLGALLAGTEAFTEPPSTLETAEFMQEVRKECYNSTGDDKAYHELVTVLNSETPRCFMQHVNMSFLQSSVDSLSAQEQAKMMEQICHQIEKSLTCINPVVAKVKLCVSDEDDLQIMQKIVDTAPEALKMICNDSGSMLLKLREPLSKSCAVELAPAIDECMDVISNSTMMMDLKDYTITECNEIYTMRDCIIAKIRECGALTYLELFSLFYKSLLSLTPCK